MGLIHLRLEDSIVRIRAQGIWAAEVAQQLATEWAHG